MSMEGSVPSLWQHGLMPCIQVADADQTEEKHKLLQYRGDMTIHLSAFCNFCEEQNLHVLERFLHV